MDTQEALLAFDALSQETRLHAFKLLVQQGPSGISAGMLRDKLGIPHNTLSFHLSHMNNAKLVIARKQGRSVIYAANFDFFSGLIRYMVENCCSGEFAGIKNDKKNGHSVIELSDCCQTPPERKKK